MKCGFESHRIQQWICGGMANAGTFWLYLSFKHHIIGKSFALRSWKVEGCSRLRRRRWFTFTLLLTSCYLFLLAVVPDVSRFLEEWPSGRRQCTANASVAKSGSQVRILLLPQDTSRCGMYLFILSTQIQRLMIPIVKKCPNLIQDEKGHYFCKSTHVCYRTTCVSTIFETVLQLSGHLYCISTEQASKTSRT